MMKKSICDTLRRTCLILAGSLIMAVNLKSFVRTGGLIPGGFNGLTRLIQEISALLWHWEPPFSVINFILNAIPAIISFKFIGKKFTLYSCMMIVVRILSQFSCRRNTALTPGIIFSPEMW